MYLRNTEVVRGSIKTKSQTALKPLIQFQEHLKKAAVTKVGTLRIYLSGFREVCMYNTRLHKLSEQYCRDLIDAIIRAAETICDHVIIDNTMLSRMEVKFVGSGSLKSPLGELWEVPRFTRSAGLSFERVVERVM